MLRQGEKTLWNGKNRTTELLLVPADNQSLAPNFTTE